MEDAGAMTAIAGNGSDPACEQQAASASASASMFVRPRPRRAGVREVGPPWARWNRGLPRRYTLGIEEELMLLRPDSCRPAQASDRVVAALSREL
jgi:hypothetical protein